MWSAIVVQVRHIEESLMEVPVVWKLWWMTAWHSWGHDDAQEQQDCSILDVLVATARCILDSKPVPRSSQ